MCKDLDSKEKQQVTSLTQPSHQGIAQILVDNVHQCRNDNPRDFHIHQHHSQSDMVVMVWRWQRRWQRHRCGLWRGGLRRGAWAWARTGCWDRSIMIAMTLDTLRAESIATWIC